MHGCDPSSHHNINIKMPHIQEKLNHGAGDIITAISASDSICQELDQLVLQYMSLVQDYLSAWTRISEKFQEGREQISQAKYIMGPRNVSADCYDLRMKALRGVSVVKDNIQVEDLLARRLNIDNSLDSQKDLDKEDQEWHPPISNEIDLGSGLRRRGGNTGKDHGDTNPSSIANDDELKKKETKQLAGESFSSSLTSSATTPKTKKKERNPDPLLWFGVFVPGSLRTAQAVFRQGLEDAAQMATVQQKLLALEKDIKALRLQKEQNKGNGN